MKRLSIILALIIAISSLAGCGIVSKETSREQSTFKQDFSIGPVVESHKELLLDEPRTLSSMEAGPREPFIQSQEVMVVQINPDNTSTLLRSVQSDIEKTLNDHGAKILGYSGGDGQPDPIAHFSYSYSEDPFYGVINVWGMRGEGTTFIIIAQITESLN